MLIAPKKIVAGEREKVSPIFQATMMIMSGLIIFMSFYYRIELFRALDEPLVHETISPQKLRELGGYPEYVDVGLEIERFQEFNVTKNQFTFTGNVWFEFEAGSVSIDTLKDFAFDRATILYRSEPDTRLLGSKLMVRFLIKVAFNTGLVNSDFPVDDHRINIVLSHPFVSPEEIIFEARATNFVFDSNLLSSGWNTIDKSVKSGFTEARLSEQGTEKMVLQPMVAFSIDVERYGARYVLAILLPIFLMFFLIFYCLSVDAAPSVAVSLGGITGILAYRYVIEQLSPPTGDLMMSDHFFFLILTSAMLVFLLNKLDLFVMQLDMKKKVLGVVLIHMFTVIASIYMLFPR